jgi:hypothetical protein
MSASLPETTDYQPAADAAGPVVAIMQPYFLPYIGYFQLIAACDLFVVYDNIKYTKKGWINRNRMLRNGSDAMFSLPLQGAPDHLDVDQRQLAATADRHRWLAQLKGAYGQAPHYRTTLPLLERIAACADDNLFRFLHHALVATCAHLGIDTPIRIASNVPADHGLTSQDRVLAILEALGARRYVNPIGGTELYSRDTFEQHGIALHFLRARPLAYPQFGADFVPWLSIVDVLMFNPLETVRGWVRTHYDLI